MEPQRDYEGELAQLQEQLAGAIRSIAAIRRELRQASERDVVELALVIAEKVTARELTIDPSLVASWARAGLEALADQDAVEIAVAPDIAAAVPPEAWTDADGAPIAPIVDPKLKPGSCDVRGELSRCDASVSARLNSVRDAIGANGVDE